MFCIFILVLQWSYEVYVAIITYSDIYMMLNIFNSIMDIYMA